MAVTDDRKFTSEQVYNLLESAKGKTLGEVDKSHQFARTIDKPKITGIAGDVIEQSVFGYERDSKQECDIEIDGVLTELKTTGVRVPKSDLRFANGKTGDEYNIYLAAKEGISVTGVTFEPDIQRDFATSHFWEKSERMLLVFYEYKSYNAVPASDYAQFPIVDYCHNSFSDEEKAKLQNDWELVCQYLKRIYDTYENQDERNLQLVGFTRVLRPNLLLIELVPAFKIKPKQNGDDTIQRPRYRLKKTFVNYIVKGHFDKSRADKEIKLKQPFSSFAELDKRCHALTEKYKGYTLQQFKELFGIDSKFSTKQFTAQCITKMFDADCKKLNDVSDFEKAGILAKTVTLTENGGKTEDMKLDRIHFGEWLSTDVEFEESEIFSYFSEHSFLCPIFKERGDMRPRRKSENKKTFNERIERESALITFEGFKRLTFDDDFMYNDIKKTWDDSRDLVATGKLKWVFERTKSGKKKKNRKSKSFKGAPNFPKSQHYNVFFRGGSNDSSDKFRTECVNGIKMLPQFFWIKGLYIVDKLNEIPFI